MTQQSEPDQQNRKSLAFAAFVFCICCFCIWLVNSSISPLLPQPEEPPRFYSNQCQQDLRLTFVNAIERAKKSIFLVMFGLSDPAVIASLQKQIRQGIETTIYYDTTGSSRLRPQLFGSKLIPVQQGGLMHQKILILDQDLVFIGSANMTKASLCMHDNLIIGLRSRKVAQFLLDRAPYSSGMLKTMVGGQDVELWLLPDPRGHALAELRRQIRNATRSIQIALFTFTHPNLVDEVIAAKERGVNVSIVVDLNSGLGASAKAVGQLRRSGVKVLFSQGVQLLHHKFVLIDEKCLISGSANWTKAAFCKNNDCLLMLSQLNSEQKNFMKRLWRRIEAEGKTPSQHRWN